jgi:hypothetical protein
MLPVQGAFRHNPHKYLHNHPEVVKEGVAKETAVLGFQNGVTFTPPNLRLCVTDHNQAG